MNLDNRDALYMSPSTAREYFVHELKRNLSCIFPEQLDLVLLRMKLDQRGGIKNHYNLKSTLFSG